MSFSITLAINLNINNSNFQSAMSVLKIYLHAIPTEKPENAMLVARNLHFSSRKDLARNAIASM